MHLEAVVISVCGAALAAVFAQTAALMVAFEGPVAALAGRLTEGLSAMAAVLTALAVEMTGGWHEL